MPHVLSYNARLHALGEWWQKVTLIGKINSHEVAATLIDDMDSTRSKLEQLQERLIQDIVHENQYKLERELSGYAQVAIDILIRNLFERTADVGFLATDEDLIHFLQHDDKSTIGEARDHVIERLHEYTLKYSVYDEIIILDLEGKVKVHLDQNNPIEQSFDPLIEETFHSHAGYVETFRHSDLQPNLHHSLIYSAPIKESSDPTARSLGILCLCFRFDDEMTGIFANLQKGNETIAILDRENQVIASSQIDQLMIGQKLKTQSEQVETITYNNQLNFTKSSKTTGYQGFYGLSWQGYVMLPCISALAPSKLTEDYNKNLFDSNYFSEELREINHTANIIIDDLILIVINGQIISAKRDAAEFMPVLTEIRHIGIQTKEVFDASIHELYATVLSSLFNDIQFQAALAVDIMDRNLYERANDVRWWALTTKFRELMEKDQLTEQDVEELTSILSYINNLYTVYTNLFIYDLNGKIVSVSNPKEAKLLGELLDLSSYFKEALNLSNSQSYVVSPFTNTFLYDDRHTYIYLKSIMGIKSNRSVGGIGIIFDSEPEFFSMLDDTLPRDENGTVVTGVFGLFCDKKKKVISSTNPMFLVGGIFNIEEKFFALDEGRRISSITTFEGRRYAIGAAMSKGYREYKTTGDYKNDIVALICVPI